jgi:hypothetical protein
MGKKKGENAKEKERNRTGNIKGIYMLNGSNKNKIEKNRGKNIA